MKKLIIGPLKVLVIQAAKLVIIFFDPSLFSINSSRYKDPFNQWYIVIQGNIHFSFEKNDDINAVEGDIVYIPKDLTYNINNLGSKTSLRMSISKPR